MASTRIDQLTEEIARRRRTYDKMWAADLRNFAKAHGDGPVSDALRMLDEQRAATKPDPWDSTGHRAAVRDGIERVVGWRRFKNLSGLCE